jgi:phasin family protein
MNKESPMTSLPERLSVVRPQWEAQLDAFHTLGNRALDSAEQLLALNLKTSRASIEQVTGTWQQMLSVTHPRDLLNIGTQAQGQWQQVFSYSRELLGIAMGARPRNLNTIQMPMQSALLGAPLDAPIAHFVEQAGIAIADAVTVTTDIAAATADSDAALAEDTMGVGDQSAPADDGAAGLPAAGQIEPSTAPADAAADAPSDAPTELDAEKTGEAPSEAPEAEAVTEAPESAAPPAGLQAAALDAETSANVEALVDIVIADAVPPAKTKVLVEALNEVAPKPAGAEHPLASTVPLENGNHIALPTVTPAESTPPVQLSNGPASERRRGSRKKS